MERKFLSLTMADVMYFAYRLAVRNGFKNELCNEKAGRKWLNTLNHQEISFRTLVGLSLSRARGFTPE
jgi:hypothetical protein